MFNKSDLKRDLPQLYGGQAKKGYDWWWHSFTAIKEDTNEEVPFFIEYFLINPAHQKDEPVYGQLRENQLDDIMPSYMMVKAGCWGKNKCQLHRFFAWKDVKLGKKAPYFVEADDCFATEKLIKGSVSVSEEDAKGHPEYMSDSGEMSWDLEVEKVQHFNVGYGASWLFRHLQLFEMFWHVEGMKTLYSGTITLNGEKYIVKKDNCYGYADKNWGKDFTSPWVWLASSNLTSLLTGKRLLNSSFDIGGGRPKIAFIPLKRKLLSAFCYEGVNYEFNFSKFWTNTRTEFMCQEEEDRIIWHIEQKTWRNKIIADIECKKEDMLLVNYEAPNGKKLHNRLWNGGNGTGIIYLYHKKKLVDKIECKNVGCEYGEYDKK